MNCKNEFRRNSLGFTLIELLVVIVIVGILASVVLVAVNRGRTKGRDAKRLADMAQIQKALALFYETNGQYPDGDFDGCGTWDVGNKDHLFLNNKLAGILNISPVDPVATGACDGYRFYRYAPGTSNCDSNRGWFYVLGVTDMETISAGSTHPESPGWKCADRNWQLEMDWVTGMYEK